MGDYIHYRTKKISRFLTSIPSPEGAIIGREKELKSLYNMLEASQKVVLMNGMGGIGKTTVAVNYVQNYKSYYRHIAWIDQLNDFTIDLLSNKVLTNNLDFIPSNNPIEDVQILLNKLSNLKGKSLLVLDNANQQLNGFKDFLPKAPDWHVLITSRESLNFAKIIPLDFLSEEDALKLFYTHYTLDKDNKNAKKILQILDYHTLTIELLAKTAQNRKINNIEAILEILKKRGLRINRRVGLKIFHSRGKKVERLFPYLLAIFELGNLNKEELYLLKQFVALPSKHITLKVFSELLQIDPENELDWDDLTITIESLREKGWLLYNKLADSYKMHRVIQDVLCEKIPPIYEDIKTLILSVSDKLYYNQDKDNPKSRFPFVNFGERIYQLIPSSNDKEYPVFQSNLGNLYLDMGQYQRAVNILEIALKSETRNSREKYPNARAIQSNLGMAYFDMSLFGQAKELLEKVLQSEIENLGEDHPIVAVNRSNLALVYSEMGLYKEASELLEKALEWENQNFKEGHLKIIRRHSNLGIVYMNLGKYEKAKQLLNIALNWAIENFGKNHPQTIAILSNLGIVYHSLKSYGEAKDFLKLSLQHAIHNLGEEHPKTATARSNLGLVLRDMKEYHEAEYLLEKAVQSNIEILGESHLNTQLAKTNLASVFYLTGKRIKAKQLFEKAYFTFKYRLGDKHPNTLKVKSWLDYGEF